MEHEGTASPQSYTSNDPLVKLAYETVKCFVSEGIVPNAPELLGAFPLRSGCFVSIHTRASGDLRGCIGTIEPVQESLAEEVIHNAIAAATQDPRFSPIKENELRGLEISVDVLFPPEPATFDELDPKRYGVVVSQGYKRGLLLPDLEGVDSVQEQVRIACMKAGINPASSFALERFEVVRHI